MLGLAQLFSLSLSASLARTLVVEPDRGGRVKVAFEFKERETK